MTTLVLENTFFSLVHVEMSAGVYNPFGINHTFAANALLERWFESGNPASLIKKLHVEEFQTLLSEHLVVNEDALNSATSPATITSLAMLYYAGYLTIRTHDSHKKTVSLSFPNTEVSRAFSNQLISELSPGQATAIQPAAVGIAQIKAKEYVRKFKHLNLPVWAIGIKLAGRAGHSSQNEAWKKDGDVSGEALAKSEDAPRNAVLELAAENIGENL